ncbi:MAG: hypothetical protein ACTSVW_00105 [Candidatus Njordarchaeales archaeon]
MSLSKILRKIIGSRRADIEGIINKHYSRYKKYVSELVVCTIDGFHLSERNPDEKSLRFISLCLKKLGEILDINKFNGRIILISKEDNIVCGYDYSILVGVRYKDTADIESIKKVMNLMLDEIGEVIL